MSEPDNPYETPRSALHPGPEHHGGSIERTLAGDAYLDIGAVWSEAWQRTSGIKGILIGSAVIVYAGAAVVAGVVGAFIGPGTGQAGVGSMVSQLATMAIVYPWTAGAVMLGLRQSVGLPVQFSQAFDYYPMVVPIVGLVVLQTIGIGIGFMLLVVPGLYLMIALSLALPLKVERGLPVLDCLVTSIKLVNSQFLVVSVMAVGAWLIFVLSLFTIVGWIWAGPWMLMVYAITYRQLAGCELEA